MEVGFETFSHFQSIVDRATWIEFALRYQPYRKLGNETLNVRHYLSHCVTHVTQ